MAKRTDTAGFGTVEDEVVATTIDAIPLDALQVDTVEFAEMEQKLPIGVWFEGERLQEFTLHPIKTKFDLVLGRLINAHKTKVVTILAQFLPQVVETIGGYPVADLASKMSLSPQRFFEGMAFGDVLMLLLHIRKAAQNSTLVAMAADCPACNYKNQDNPTKNIPFHDLAGLDIPVVRELSQKPVFEVLLEDGLAIHGETIRRILMQPPKLHHMNKISDAMAVTDVEMLYCMVVGLPDSEIYGKVKGQVFGDDLYGELTIKDLARLRDAIEKIQLVPDMSVEMTCARCGHEWDSLVNWGNLRAFLFTAPTAPK